MILIFGSSTAESTQVWKLFRGISDERIETTGNFDRKMEDKYNVHTHKISTESRERDRVLHTVRLESRTLAVGKCLFEVCTSVFYIPGGTIEYCSVTRFIFLFCARHNVGNALNNIEYPQNEWPLIFVLNQAQRSGYIPYSRNRANEYFISVFCICILIFICIYN